MAMRKPKAVISVLRFPLYQFPYCHFPYCHHVAQGGIQ
uniref:Uncharacterized protein n=1 Tax=uncultured bacterium A1Q1_fos_1815 TaxID=1256553 RepID=L7VV90_9BACT|nr:hypothetical protein [uncultured bacterium A1Q1_fos_1815]